MFKCVTRGLDYRVEQSNLGILGCARTVLTEDERDMGCLLIDIGGGTTDFMIFAESEPIFKPPRYLQAEARLPRYLDHAQHSLLMPQNT
jgi:hypothetical protein